MDITTYALCKKIAESSGSGLPPVTESDNGKIAIVAGGAWTASINQVEISADYDPATGFFTQRPSADVPTADELNIAFTCNGAVIMHVFVNDHQSGIVYLYPFGDENDDILFGTVLRNKNEDYDESINVLFSVDDDVVEFTVDRSKTPKGRFIVTLTPTAQDFSGTMDKTVAEINSAYEAGQEIWFKVAVGTDWTEYPLSRVGKMSGYTYPSFNCNALYDENNVLVMIYTGTTSDGTQTFYSTKLYTLTPAT